MKIFLDSANLDEVKKAVRLGVVDGVTTNPSLIAKERVPLEDRVRELCQVVTGDVSASVVGRSAEEMIAEGRALAAVHEQVVVKIPMSTEGIVAVSALSKEDIRTNVTLCFSAAQALLAAKAGAYIVSPFVGRLDDLGWPGIELIRDIVAIYRTYNFGTQILAASIRGTLPFVEAAKAGAHIVTVPLKILEQMFSHPLTERGMEQFLHDYNQAFQLDPTEA